MRGILLMAVLTTAGAGCGPAGEEETGSTEPLPPVEVRATVDKAVATTGDRITYTVAVQHQPGIEVEIPEIGAEIAGLRIIDSQVFPIFIGK